MTEYRCETCSGPIMDGQHITLTAFVLSVVDQRLSTAKIHHEMCYTSPATTPRVQCPDEYCAGWKDSGICPNDLRHDY